MTSSLVILLSWAIFGASGATISPVLKTGNVTLLYHNDLDISTATSHLSALLLSSQDNSDAVSACNSLHESLLPTQSNETFSDIVSLLKYQVFSGNFESGQEFWISSDGSGCRAVDTEGVVKPALCTESLPVLCSQSAGFSAGPTTETEVTMATNNLTVTGFRDLKSFKFLGIPYADAPARWTYPTTYSGPTTLDATKFGATCVQPNMTTGTSEDCLFLNIWTPAIPQSGATSKESLKPVLFWIYGGGFLIGSGADPTYDGGNMASRGDVVLVTINYRLSTLGFLSMDDGETNGNFGLADQIMALDWVRENIAGFGGDPDRITIAGQSAGASSVRVLLGSPKAIGKFAAAVLMSSPAGADPTTEYALYYTLSQAQEIVTNPILQTTGCTGSDALDCLKKIDAQTLMELPLPIQARLPVVDGTIITANGLQFNNPGKVARVHTLIGFMRDDATLFIAVPTNDNLTQELEASFNVTTAVVNSPLFPLPDGLNATEQVFNVTARAATDVFFRCLDQATAFSAVQHNTFESLWFYEFNRSYQQPEPSIYPADAHCNPPIDAAHPHGDPSKEYFKCHAGELYYVFGSLPETMPLRDELDLPFMQMSLDIWASFARGW